MKKVTGIILALTLVATLRTTSVLAASTEQRGGVGCNASGAACQFVDENKDGIRDIHGTDCQFIDEDKDDICDNYPNGGILCAANRRQTEQLINMPTWFGVSAW